MTQAQTSELKQEQFKGKKAPAGMLLYDYKTNKEKRDRYKHFLFHNIKKYIELGFSVYPRVITIKGELFFINVKGEYKAEPIRDTETLKNIIDKGITDTKGNKHNIINFCFNPNDLRLVVVDLDNHNESDTIERFKQEVKKINRFNYKIDEIINNIFNFNLCCDTPRKGKHIYFKNDKNFKKNDLVDFKKIGISVDYLFKNCTCIGSSKILNIKGQNALITYKTNDYIFNFDNLNNLSILKAPYTNTSELIQLNNNVNSQYRQVIKGTQRENNREQKGDRLGAYFTRDLTSIYNKATEKNGHPNKGYYHDFIMHFCLLIKQINNDETNDNFYNSNDVFNFLMSTNCREHDQRDTERIIKDFLK